jgi:ribosome-associated toxin RatA of RatAB toxin-antitoxin module
MPFLEDEQSLPYPIEKVFDVAMDVERYPEILSYVKSVRILSRRNGRMEVAVALGLSFIRFTYHCVIDYQLCKQIDVVSNERLFKKFVSRCVFVKDGEGQTTIRYQLDAVFANPLLEALAKVAMPYQAKATMRAFQAYLLRG